MSERMRRWVGVRPVLRHGREQAYGVFLDVGAQSFCVASNLDSEAVAEFVRAELCAALERVVRDTDA